MTFTSGVAGQRQLPADSLPPQPQAAVAPALVAIRPPSILHLPTGIRSLRRRTSRGRHRTPPRPGVTPRISRHGVDQHAARAVSHGAAQALTGSQTVLTGRKAPGQASRAAFSSFLADAA